MEKRLTPEEQEQMFQDALQHWIEHKDKKSWDMIL